MDIKNVGIIGAGTMGNGIAQVCALAGLNVVMLDVMEEIVAQGLSTISASLDRLVKKEKLTASEKHATTARIRGTTQYSEMAGADLIIEAATECATLKARILTEIDSGVSPQAIIATNTSSISITKLAACISQPSRFIGIHFFNPVPLMALVELVRGLQTSDEVFARSESFVKAIGKSSIVAGNSPGFAVNRILCPMINEAVFALQEGVASAEDIDNGIRLGANHPIGPLALADLIGLDTMLSIMEVLYQGFGDSKYRPAPLLREMVDAGRLGRKSGLGFFQYD